MRPALSNVLFSANKKNDRRHDMEKETLARFLAASRTYLGLRAHGSASPGAYACMTSSCGRLPVYAAVFPLSTMGVEQ